MKKFCKKKKLKALDTVIEFIRKPRGILDIFTPYSINSIRDTANSNYNKMNNNFNKVHMTEVKLQHQQAVIAQNFGLMEKNELDLARKEMFLEIRSFQQQSLTNFIFELNQIILNNKSDSNYEIVFQL